MNATRCKDCKWWKPAGPFRDGPQGQGNVWVEELGTCVQDRHQGSHVRSAPKEERKTSRDAIAIAEWIVFHTGPEFGCVHAESKGEAS